MQKRFRLDRNRLSQQLVQDTPEDALDEDYFRLPDNPTLSDQYRHARWKKKKYGGL
jgi:hypothetical protein